MTAPLRIVIADDERPARSFLAALLRTFDDVRIVGEADSGRQAVSVIVREKPDLALLDLHMPELDGLGVIRALKKHEVPLVAFVTAYEEYAVRAFELNAVDYLLKPVDKVRLRDTLNRAHERMERQEGGGNEDTGNLNAAAAAYESVARPGFLDRIPIRKRDELIFVAVEEIASVVAEGELLHIFTVKQARHTITYRLKDLEARLDPSRFVRLGRGTLANLNALVKVNVMPGGSHVALLGNGQKLQISRIQSRRAAEQAVQAIAGG
jgi:two-component system LytT family response regulator